MSQINRTIIVLDVLICLYLIIILWVWIEQILQTERNQTGLQAQLTRYKKKSISDFCVER